MITPTQSRHYARMVRNFTLSEAKAYNDHLLAGKRAEDFFAKMEKHLAGQHDQSSHGSWASETFEDLSVWIKKSEEEYGINRRTSQAEIELQQVAQGFNGSSNPEYASSISIYQGKYGKIINEALRDPLISTNQVEKQITELDEVLDSAPPLKEQVLAYRGISGKGLEFFENLKVGDVFQDKGYVSTTLSAKIAGIFAGADLSPDFQGMVLQFHLPKGTKGLFPTPFLGLGTASYPEMEFLLPRDSKFKVTQIRGKIIDVEITK
jgi:hypothetical protein